MVASVAAGLIAGRCLRTMDWQVIRPGRVACGQVYCSPAGSVASLRAIGGLAARDARPGSVREEWPAAAAAAGTETAVATTATVTISLRTDPPKAGENTNPPSLPRIVSAGAELPPDRT